MRRTLIALLLAALACPLLAQNSLQGNDPIRVEVDSRVLKTFFAARAPRGFEVASFYFGDQDHGSVVLPSQHAALAALKKIFAPWRFTFERGDDPKTLLPHATEHHARLSKRTGFDGPVPENLVNQFGYILLGRNDVEAAIAVFRRNVELYPKSANVYDSLGEALEKAGNVEGARQSYQRASAIGQETNDPNTHIFKTNAERVMKK